MSERQSSRSNKLALSSSRDEELLLPVITDTGLTVIEAPCCMRHNVDHVRVLSNHVRIRNEGSIGASLWRAITHEVLHAKTYVMHQKKEQR